MLGKIAKRSLFALCIFSFIMEGVLGEETGLISKESKVSEVVVEGRLAWVKMTNFPDISWKELALIDEEGMLIAILIGKKVEEILEKEGAKVKIKGLRKPEMIVKGEKTPVIEVREIELLSE